MSAQPPVPMFDAYAPSQIAVRVRDVGAAKATAPFLTMLALAVLAGAFISLGALFYTVTVTIGGADTAASFGLVRLAGGITFSLGLVLVVVGGAELFTGN
ncbi:MAG: formate/nitrite transporter family protein, partial [Nitrospirota bacterium]